MYWLLGQESKLDLNNKRLLYLMIIRLIWTYGIQLWGYTRNSNRMIIQRIQNGIIRNITNARWYQRNEDLHRDLNIQTVNDIIKSLVLSDMDPLREHPNAEATQLLNYKQGRRRLKRNKSQDLI